jgi:quinol monooxygenase YgiN
VTCAVVELRRYTLHPGARETLIELFERELITSQEAVGMHVLGQFRDLDDPDAFVWLRGFRDMQARRAGLRAFYEGPVWRSHRDAANATMVDSDDVLLLRPVRPGSGLPGARPASPGLIAVTIYHPAEPVDAFPEVFDNELEPVLRRTGAAVLARYRTEHSRNDFPPLPVREGEEVFIWLARFEDPAAHAGHLAELERTRVPRVLEGRLERPPTVFRLMPTARSLLR